jgi:uncharacterized protein (DUF1778 family)
MADLAMRSEKLELRISPAGKAALRQAAASARQSLSEFVMESAMMRAEELLARQTSLVLPLEQWSAFLAALDSPPATPNARLKRLLAEPDIFKR